jgi:hypothetical protein
MPTKKKNRKHKKEQHYGKLSNAALIISILLVNFLSTIKNRKMKEGKRRSEREGGGYAEADDKYL